MKREQGFTLIEVMLVVLLVGAMAFIVLPGMNNMMVRNRLVTDMNDLTAALTFARSEAIKRGGDVVVCKSDAPTGCPTNAADCCTTTGDWSQGWVIFADVDGNQSMISGDGDILISIGGALSSVNVLKGSGNAADWVKFDRNGFSTANSGDTITACNANDNKILGRTISSTGRVSIAASYTCN